MRKTLIRNVQVVNENSIRPMDILVDGNLISKLSGPNTITNDENTEVISGEGLHLFPGLIDDQVHFREPGLTHKGELFTESRAAVAGGITSFMEMPNTVPAAITIERLEEKYSRAAEVSLAIPVLSMEQPTKAISK